MILSIDEVYDILEEVYGEFPEPLLDRLNGGVLLLEEALPDPEAGEDVYILGDYCNDELGRYINIYYGSFAALFFDEPREVWVDELRTTLRHELTHHIEGLAGDRSLERWDEEELEWFKKNSSGQMGGQDV